MKKVNVILLDKKKSVSESIIRNYIGEHPLYEKHKSVCHDVAVSMPLLVK